MGLQILSMLAGLDWSRTRLPGGLRIKILTERVLYGMNVQACSAKSLSPRFGQARLQVVPSSRDHGVGQLYG